ncbi:MAG: patatin-like phospholipase family protein [Limnochordales bacterium]|nr:patatin-like phospholipase family protein [Limnochordales bacterium]
MAARSFGEDRGSHGSPAGRRRVALVLSGGAARGLAHIGVLQVLTRERFPIDLVVGTSIGALVGALYTAGLDLNLVAGLAARLNWRHLVRVAVPRRALFEPVGLERILKLLLRDRHFSQLSPALAVTAVDLHTGAPVLLREGPLVSAVMASAAIPGIFPPVERDGYLLVDGGVLQRLPVRAARSLGADYVIAVDVSAGIHRAKTASIWDTLMTALDIMGREMSRGEAEAADCLIRPDLGQVSGSQLSWAGWLIRRGREAAEAALPILRRDLASTFC